MGSMNATAIFQFECEWLIACIETATMKNNATTKTEPKVSGILGLAILGGIALLCLSSCSTMSGFGRDVENTGEEIQDAAN